MNETDNRTINGEKPWEEPLVLIDTYEEWKALYDDKDEYRECAELEEDEEIDEQSFCEWISGAFECHWEDFMHMVGKHEGKYAIFGSVGRWNGEKEIVPVVTDGLKNAICKCVDNVDEVRVALNQDGWLEVTGWHHDGTNSFTVKKVAEKSWDLLHCIDFYGEDEDYKWSDVEYEKFTIDDF